MQSYTNLFTDELEGDTPKEKYEYLIELKKAKSDLDIKMVSVKTFLDGMSGTPDFATLGDLRIWFASLEKIVNR